MRFSFLPFAANYRIHIRACGHKNSGNHASHKPISGIDDLPARLELVFIAGILQNIPCLISGNVFQTRQHGVRHVRPTIRKAVAMPVRSEFDALLSGKEIELCMGRRRQRQRQGNHQCGKKESFVHKTPVRISSLKLDFVVNAKISHGDRLSNRWRGIEYTSRPKHGLVICILGNARWIQR